MSERSFVIPTVSALALTLGGCNLTINADDLSKGSPGDGEGRMKSIVGSWGITQIDDQIWPFYSYDYLVSGTLVAAETLATTFTLTYAGPVYTFPYVYNGMSYESTAEDGTKNYEIHATGADGLINLYCTQGDANTLYCQDDSASDITFIRQG